MWLCYSSVRLVLYLPNNLVWVSLFGLKLLFWCPQRPRDSFWMSQILLTHLLGEQAQHCGAVFHSIFLSRSARSLSTLFKPLEYTQVHLLAPPSSCWLLKCSTRDADHLRSSLTWVPKELDILCMAEGVQQKWRAHSVLYTEVSQDKALFLGCEFRKMEDLCWGG